MITLNTTQDNLKALAKAGFETRKYIYDELIEENNGEISDTIFKRMLSDRSVTNQVQIVEDLAQRNDFERLKVFLQANKSIRARTLALNILLANKQNIDIAALPFKDIFLFHGSSEDISVWINLYLKNYSLSELIKVAPPASNHWSQAFWKKVSEIKKLSVNDIDLLFRNNNFAGHYWIQRWFEEQSIDNQMIFLFKIQNGYSLNFLPIFLENAKNLDLSHKCTISGKEISLKQVLVKHKNDIRWKYNLLKTSINNWKDLFWLEFCQIAQKFRENNYRYCSEERRIVEFYLESHYSDAIGKIVEYKCSHPELYKWLARSIASNNDYENCQRYWSNFSF